MRIALPLALVLLAVTYGNSRPARAAVRDMDCAHLRTDDDVRNGVPMRFTSWFCINADLTDSVTPPFFEDEIAFCQLLPSPIDRRYVRWTCPTVAPRAALSRELVRAATAPYFCTVEAAIWGDGSYERPGYSYFVCTARLDLVRAFDG